MEFPRIVKVNNLGDIDDMAERVCIDVYEDGTAVTVPFCSSLQQYYEMIKNGEEFNPITWDWYDWCETYEALI